MNAQTLHAAIIARLDELEAILKAATPGPWFTEKHGCMECDIAPIARFGIAPSHWDNITRDANCRLSVTSRNLMPGMLAYLRAQAEMHWESFERLEPEFETERVFITGQFVALAEALGLEASR